AVLAALPYRGGGGCGVVQGGRGGEQQVERDQRRASGDQDRAGAGVDAPGPEVGLDLAVGQPSRQLVSAASAQLGPGAAVAQRAIEEDGGVEVAGELVGGHQRLGAGGA